jgi:hypothetical protein
MKGVKVYTRWDFALEGKKEDCRRHKARKESQKESPKANEKKVKEIERNESIPSALIGRTPRNRAQ